MPLSPMMKHYLSVKDEYPDCIIFYRLGDFYEMFFDDAKRASEILELVLTGRDCGLEQKAPMCGVPFHAADSYIAKLVAAGEKVAICEQLEDPATAKGMVARGVVRVVSAGTMTDDSALSEKNNNYIALLYAGENTAALSYADITTGDFYAIQREGDNALSAVLEELVILSPAEVVANDRARELTAESPAVSRGMLPRFRTLNASLFNRDKCEAALKKQFSVLSLAAFFPEGAEAAKIASGALLGYLLETQKHELPNLCAVKYIEQGDGLILDYNALRNLEILNSMRDGKRFGSLLWVLDKTRTGMGARRLIEWLTRPLNDPEEIDFRLDGVEELTKSTLLRQSIGELLSAVKDLSRLAGRISNDKVSPRDALSLCSSLRALPGLKFQLSTLTSAAMQKATGEIADLEDLERLLSSAIDPVETPQNERDGGFIQKGYSKELDELKSDAKNGRSLIAEMESREREKTGIKNLKISYNRVFGYYIEVTNSYKELVPYDYQRKQTTVNAERYITEELKTLEERILGADEKSIALELRLFDDIKRKIRSRLPEILKTASAIGYVDCLLSLATVAKENRYVRPKVLPSGEEMKITAGRHPVVEAVSKEQFVPNDTLLDNGENRTMIITGPNMAGKSTYMRQVALIAIMAHAGSFVPAREAEIPMLDRVFTRVGASDNLIFDQSTFMVEMTEVAAILQRSTENSLLVLDEVGRGTSTYDGLSIAWAVVEHITEKIKAKTLFATHYHELTELEGRMDGTKNYKVTVKETDNSVVFLRKIVRGGANRSFGVEVAALAGVPKEVTDRAKAILKKLEKKDLLGAKGKKADLISEIAAEDAAEVSASAAQGDENMAGSAGVSAGGNEMTENQKEALARIREADPDRMTPLSALSFVSELSELLKGE